MIRIIKPIKGPAILNTRGKNKRTILCTLYTKFHKAYIKGTKSFEFDSSIYSHTSVKTKLLQSQNGKCAFCESKIDHISFGDVEHFRPKGGYRQTENDNLIKPGYYWLAYNWENLLLSCSLCNQRHKRNLFPISTPTDRAKTHKHDISKETPLFINPANEDPEQFISFNREIACGIGNTAKGTETIKGLGLNRPELSEYRYDYYRKLKICYELINTLGSTIPNKILIAAQDELNIAISDNAQYSSMIRAAVKTGFTI